MIPDNASKNYLLKVLDILTQILKNIVTLIIIFLYLIYIDI